MFKWILAALTIATVVSGCGGKSSSESTYLLPWLDASGKYALQEVTISTLTSAYAVKGSAAEIYVEPNFSDSGFTGRIAEPRLAKSGGVYIPMDLESSLALTVYAQFEQLYKYERAAGFASQLVWPRKVGVELNLVGGEGSEHNNAHYFSAVDVIGILPYSLSGVPFAVNHGIVAHEHFHAHFQQQVLNPLNQITGLQVVSALEDLFYGALSLREKAVSEDRTPKFLNDIVMRGWNEGLADLFASIYVGRADFFTASMPKVSQARALDQPLSRIWTGADLTASANNVEFNRSQLVGLAYMQGTAVARLLYRAAFDGVESPELFLQRVMSHLGDVPMAVHENYLSQVMDFDFLLPVLLKDFPLSQELCGDLRLTITKATLMRSFGICASP